MVESEGYFLREGYTPFPKGCLTDMLAITRFHRRHRRSRSVMDSANPANSQ